MHTIKAIVLFILGWSVKGFVSGDDSSYLLDVLYLLALIWLSFKFYTSYKPMPVPASDFNVCIVGAGFSGIGMAIKLNEIGVKYRIIEKGPRFGGTWWDNQYPGCACDVPSHLYRSVVNAEKYYGHWNRDERLH